MAKEKYNDKQLSALTTLDKNVIVSAGAGSGKTKVLSNRFLEILKRYSKDGINADNILAITFTIKAANEMKERVRKNMLERMAEDLLAIKNAKDEVVCSQYQEDYDLWNCQLKKLEMAKVSTIDSLCSSILIENILEARIAPGSEMIEDHDNHELYDECVARFISKTLADKTGDCFSILNEDLRNLVREYGLLGFKKQLKMLMNTPKAVLDFQRSAEDCDDDVIRKLQAQYEYSSDAFDNLKNAVRALGSAVNSYEVKYKHQIELKNDFIKNNTELNELQAKQAALQTEYEASSVKCKALDEKKKELSKNGDKEGGKAITLEWKAAKLDKEEKYKPIKELKAQIKEVKGQIPGKTEQNYIISSIILYEELVRILPKIVQDLDKSKPSLKTYEDSILVLNIPKNHDLQTALELTKDAYNKVCPYVNNDRAKELVPSWYRVLRAFDEYFTKRKDEENILTFEDIENKALELLQNNISVRRKYQKQYMFIMVDEFQDTNELQKKLVYLLYGDAQEHLEKPNATEALRQEFKLKNLFVVGDPKQSIYRFRGADVTVFHQVEMDMTSLDDDNPNKGILIPMNTNYRSDKKILDACNQFFPNIMSKDKTETVFYEDLEWGGFTVEDGADVELLNVPAETKEARETEAKALAQRILELHNEGWKYSKITVLLRSMKHCDKLTEAFQQGNIPYVVSSGHGFYQQEEVVDILYLLKAITNASCVTELVGTLCSPYFNFREHLLTELALDGSLSSFYKMQQHPDENVKQAAELLTSLGHMAKILDPKSFWRELWQKLRIEEVLLCMRNGRVKLANVEKLRESALNYCEQTNGTLENWLDRVFALREDEEVKEKCAVVPSDDAVNIMTIHGSKGLQFPVVIVPMLDTDFNDRGGYLAFSSEVGLGLKVKDEEDALVKTSVYVQAKAADDELDDEERARVLYVAMTRAENVLILSGTIGGKNAETDEVQEGIAEKNGIKKVRAMSWLKQFAQGVKDKHEDNGSNYVVAAVDTIKGMIASFLGFNKKPAEEVMTMNGVEGLEKQGNEAAVAESAAEKHSHEANDNDKKLIVQPDVLSSYNKIGAITFTPTSLQTYASCSLSYFYQYALGIPGLYQENASKSYIRFKNNEEESEHEEVIPLHEYRGELNAPKFGNLLHRALELYGNGGCTVFEAFEQSKLDNEIDDQDCGRALEMLETYTQSDLYVIQIQGAAKLLNEQKFTAYLFGKYRMVGVFDCLAFDADGNMHIIDYKTGHYHKDNDGYGIQLALYREVADKLFGQNGKRKVLDAKLHYIPDGKEWDLDKDGTKDYLKEAYKIFDRIASGSKEEDFSKGDIGVCSQCGYNFMCVKYLNK